MSLFDTHIVVDWSARSTPSPRRPTKDAIWVCVAWDGKAQVPLYFRTRAKAREALEHLILAERACDRRTLIGFDFHFGYPEGTARALTGHDTGFALWEWIAARVKDEPDNASNRFEVASAINACFDGIGPCWGRPETQDAPLVPTKGSARYGQDHPDENRLSDARAKGAKTVWQLAYAGAVGSQVLLGLPMLWAWRETFRAEVWPFDHGLSQPKGDVVLVELYLSLLRAEISAKRKVDEVLDAAQVRVNAGALAQLDQSQGLAALFTPPMTDQEAQIVAREEGWTFGLGFEDDLRAAA